RAYSAFRQRHQYAHAAVALAACEAFATVRDPGRLVHRRAAADERGTEETDQRTRTQRRRRRHLAALGQRSTQAQLRAVMETLRRTRDPAGAEFRRRTELARRAGTRAARTSRRARAIDAATQALPAALRTPEPSGAEKTAGARRPASGPR